MNKITYIISHIPKTAGSSLRVHFQNHLKDQVEFIHLANKGHKKAKSILQEPFQLRSEQQRNLARVILGHQVNYKTKTLVSKNQIKEIVVFREPLSWEISRFNQYAGYLQKYENKTLDFKSWCDPYKITKIHSQFDWFLENYAKKHVRNLEAKERDDILSKILKNIDHVMFVEDLPNCFIDIFSDLRIPTLMKKNANVVGLDKVNFYKNNTDNNILLKNICAKDIDTYTSLYSIYGLS